MINKRKEGKKTITNSHNKHYQRCSVYTRHCRDDKDSIDSVN